MTCLEKWRQYHPNEDERIAIENLCPNDDFHIDIADPEWCNGKDGCDRCWNREIPNSKPAPVIKDSGERREFETGAVRDIQEGKGRCDLMPLDVVSDYLTRDGEPDHILARIGQFQKSNDTKYLMIALDKFNEIHWLNNKTMLLEVAIHFEEGCRKYGENNWKKGIPVRCYIDSAVRHYLKWLRGDKDEPHDRAFCWNIICAIWTCKHKPELNDYKEN